jgi:orotate phosphoribosyltransferase
MVVIEDLLSTGGSVLEACEAAKREGADVLGVAAIFTYELPQVQENFDQAGLSYVTLTNYTALIESALETGAIQESDVALLQEWRKDPAAWLSE